MVSPSKKKKSEKKGRETQAPAPLNHVNQQDLTKKTNSKSSSRKPLATKKVYLDIRSTTVLTKLEKDLKQLGAKVEPFLDTDIDYFVTDRSSASTTATKCANQLNQALGTPSPFVVSAGGPSPSPSPGLLTAAGGSTSSAAAAAVPSPSPGGGGNNVGLRRNGSSHHHVTRSRAEAMLDCVRAPFLANDVTTLNNHNHQHQHTTVDPIENARAHNVPIYQVQQFVRWVEKLIERTKSAGGSSSQQRRVKVLNKEFLKLEECNGRNKRPEFRELNLWPTLRYEGTPGGPFETRGGSARLAATASGNKRLQRQNAPQQLPAQPQRSSRRGVKQTQAAAAADRMTRKDTAASGLGGGGGYCEMCCLDYGDLSQHLASPGHLKLAQDPAQYAALDSLIRDACLDTLLSNGTDATGANNHCSIVLSPLNVGGFTNNNNSTSSSRRVLRSARGGGGGASVIAPQQNGVACAGMGNRQASSPSNGHHNTRSSQQQQKGGKVASSPQEVKDNTPATPVLNGIINHNHLTRLSVRTDLAAVATPTLATPTTLVTPTESEVGVASGASGGGRTRQASGGTSSRSSTCGVDATATCGQHLLRSKKQLRLPQALQGTTAEDQDTPRGGLDTPRGAVDTPRGGVDTPRGGVDTPRGGESSRMMLKRRRCKMRRRKRLSVEEKLIEDNRSYYKVEVLNSKLRSTGYYMSQRELELNRGTSATRGDHHQPQLHCSVANSSAAAATAAATSVANSCSMSPPPALTETGVPTLSPEKQPVVMRFKKVRKSELSLLSDEAENFMFGDTSRQHHHHPHHHLRSSDHDDDDDHHQHHEEYEEECEDDEENTTSTAGTRSGGLSTVAPLADESSNCSSLSNLPLKRGRPGRPPKKNKRKRRTHAELFINDNLDYYKFDLSGSRLRHGGQVKVEEEVEGGRREADGVLGRKIKEEIKEEVQSDEEEADGEEGEEFGKQLTADEISFAFESAPVHESWYQTYRRQDEAREQYMQAYHSYPVLRLPYEYRDKQKRRLLAQMASGSGAKAFAFRRRKKRGSGGGVLSSVLGKRGVSALDDKPRKSPRCHASTLAILSTLKYRRRRISPLTSLSPSATTTLSQMTPTKSSIVVDEPATISSPAVTENVTISRTRMLENSAKVGRRRRLVPSEDFVALADSLDNYFCEFYFENGGVEEDRYASTMRKLVDCWVECQSGTGSSDVVGDEEVEVKKEESLSPSTSKRLAKPKHSPSTSSEPDPSSSSSSVQPCCCTRDVDPAIFDDNWLMGGDFATSRGDFALSRGDFASSGVFPPGPQQDFLQLLAGYRQCNSMERALYGGHTINPRAVESLRRHVVTSLTGGGGGGGTAAESCASSECGGSSTGELLGFTEDGRMLSKRRKRKKRNMTGWPKDKPKKLLVQQQLKMATTSGCSRSLQKVDEQEVEAEEESLVLKLRRTATKCDDATADDDNSSCGESVRVRRNEADENSSSGDRVSRVRRDLDKVVDENIISGDRVRRCRVLSVSGVDGGATTSTRSVLRRRAASMTSSRRGGGGRRGGRRGGGVRR